METRQRMNLKCIERTMNAGGEGSPTLSEYVSASLANQGVVTLKRRWSMGLGWCYQTQES